MDTEDIGLVRYYIGTSGWHYDDWRGFFYPVGLPKAKWLGFYAGTFSTLELNNSFYHLPSEAAYKNWYDSSPSDFVFAVKMSRFVTHIKRLKDCDEAVQKFMSRAVILKEKLGPLLYQLPPGLKRDDELLGEFLKKLPRELKHVFEFRNESWFDEAVFEILRKNSAGFCVFDKPDMSTPVLATADFAYVRFHGRDGLYSGEYSDDELSEWAEKIERIDENVQSVFIYFNNDIGGHAIKNALTISKHLSGKKSS
jgi:uncharacterized protein YecE (DUF72 family)